MIIFIKTLGCRANRYESEKLANNLADSGHEIVSEPDNADVVIVNTCTVTHTADRKSRQEIYPWTEKKVIVFGCGPRVNPEQFDADLVAKEPSEVLEYLGKGSGGKIHDVFLTRSNLKIQDGCENFCTYCIIPFARGKCSSKPFSEVMTEARALNAKEIVLTGINIGNWKDSGMDFWDLMKVMLDKLDARIRISSIEPFIFNKNIKEVLTHPRFCKHLHICLQSGSKGVLKRMGRKYELEDFENLIKKIREIVPDIAITTDLIVGFPGETDAQHEESLQFLERVGFAKVHVFKYSRREGTPAAKVDEQVPYSVKVQRSREARELAEKMRQEYMTGFVGMTREVLFEHEKNGVWIGTTDNYLQVEMKSKRNLKNCLIWVRLGNVKKNGRVKGRVVS
ncbi:MiaB/RimO family radical SAM methylthiotransferase [Patescibacteria group bacterium]|nr:MiaB/RimO family radical SAM methylthiotransferase [Patescibacteria group bacterium]